MEHIAWASGTHSLKLDVRGVSVVQLYCLNARLMRPYSVVGYMPSVWKLFETISQTAYIMVADRAYWDTLGMSH